MNKLFFIIVIVSFFQTSLLAGGGWPQPKGKAYLKLSEWWLVADRHYTDTGLTDPNTTMGIFNTSLYAEYGITNKLTGILYFPFFSRNYMNNVISRTTGETLIEGEAINALGDIDLGVKYGFFQNDKVAISGTLLLGLPVGKTNAGRDGNLATGDGEFNQLVQADVGVPFNLIKGISTYANAYFGFNNRTNDYSDELRFGGELGFGFLNSRIWLIGRLTNVASLKNGADASTQTGTSIFANNTEFNSYSIEGAFYLTKKLGVSVGYASAFRGEIILAAPSYNVGVFLDLK